MKKLFLFLACVVFAVAVQAQRVYNISGVSKGGKTCTIVVNGKSYVVNPYLYKRVKANPSAYVFVEYIDETFNEWTVALKENVFYSVLAVDSVGIDDNDDPALFLSDKTVYRSKNEDWLKVNIGQHVALWHIDGETKVIKHVYTVPRDVALTSEVPIENGTPTLTQVLAQPPTQMQTAAQAQNEAQTKTADPKAPAANDVAANTPPANTTPTQPIRLIRR